MRAFFILFFLVLPVSEERALADWDYQGQISGFGGLMPSQSKSDVDRQSAGTEISGQVSTLFSESWLWQVSPWVRYDSQAKSAEDQSQFELKDFFLQKKWASQKIKLGWSTVTWEGTDFFNPMDILHAKNYRDPLNSQSRSSAGVFYGGQADRISWDVVYIPKQTKSRLPGERSPWWPRQLNIPLQTDEFEMVLPSNIEYQLEEDEEIGRPLDHNVGLRFQVRGENWDMSLAGFEGSSGAPVLLPTAVFDQIVAYPKPVYQARSPFRIRPLYYRQRIGAAAVTVTLGTWIFRLAGQNSQPLSQDSRLVGWSHYGVFEIEKSLSFFQQEPVLFLELIGAQRAENGNLSMISNLYGRSLLLGWRWPLGEKWLWNSGFFFEDQTRSSYWHQEIVWNWTEHWSQKFSGDIFSGREGSVLGTYDDNDRYQWSLVFVF